VAGGSVTFDPNQDRVVVASAVTTDGTSGNGFAVASVVGNPYTFTGQRYDPEGVGQLYYKKRYYQPALGRFLSRDPAGTVDGPNLYAYVKNAPTAQVDPYGLQAGAGLEARAGIRVGLEFLPDDIKGAAKGSGYNVTSLIYSVGGIVEDMTDPAEMIITGRKLVGQEAVEETGYAYDGSEWFFDFWTYEQRNRQDWTGPVNICDCTAEIRYSYEVWGSPVEQLFAWNNVYTRWNTVRIYEYSFILKIHRARAKAVGAMGAAVTSGMVAATLAGPPGWFVAGFTFAASSFMGALAEAIATDRAESTFRAEEVEPGEWAWSGRVLAGSGQFRNGAWKYIKDVTGGGQLQLTGCEGSECCPPCCKE
jgi:RHS repeat-associated protein